MTPASLCLLGPQRLRPTVVETLPALGVPDDVPIATITAGWQEREGDDGELDAHLGGRTANLALYRRAEEVARRDRDLDAALHARQETLRRLQRLYRLRLGHALEGVRELIHRESGDPLARAEREHAIEQVRELDRRHLTRVEEVHAEFESRWRPVERDAVARERAEIARIVRGSGAVAIAGGHVAILLNRLRLFGLRDLLDGARLVAWSAGAMAIAETVVLFHDDPPQGAGHPEAMERGLGLAHAVVPFPHARRRLRLEARDRVLLAARRFAPAACVPLDEGDRLDWTGAAWRAADGARRLGLEGEIERWTAA